MIIVLFAKMAGVFGDALFAHKLLDTMFERQERRSKLHILFFTLLPALASVSLCLVSITFLRLILFGTAVLLLSAVTHKGELLPKIFAVILIMSIVLIGDNFVSGIVYSVRSDYHVLLSENQLYYLPGVALYYLYIFIALQIFRLFPKQRGIALPISQSLLLVAVPLTVATATLLLLNYLERLSAVSPAIYFGSSAIFLLLLLLITAFLRSASNIQNYIREQTALNTQIAQYDAQYGSLERAYSALRELRHNWRNLLGVARTLASSGDVDGFANYLTDNETLFAENDYTIYSGNSVVDILLSDLALRAEQTGILLAITAKLPSELGINRADLCVLLSNAFDNAIEACSQILRTEKSIAVSVYLKGVYLYFSVVNSIEAMPLLNNGKYVSGKPNPEFHGFSLNSIERIVEKYDGNLTLEHNDLCFSLQCILAIH